MDCKTSPASIKRPFTGRFLVAKVKSDGFIVKVWGKDKKLDSHMLLSKQGDTMSDDAWNEREKKALY